jgi:hypothetical protein
MSSNPTATHQLEAMHLNGGEIGKRLAPADVPSDSIFKGLTNHT